LGLSVIDSCFLIDFFKGGSVMWKKTEIIGLIGLLLVILIPCFSAKALSQVEPYGISENWKDPDIGADRWRTGWNDDFRFQVQPYGVYEDWEDPEIRSDRWGRGQNDNSLEVKREIHWKRLEMKYRVMGSSNIYQNRLYTKDPSTITQIEADFKVVSLSVENCQNNQFTKAVPALIDLAMFNDGSSLVTGNATGDYFARVLVRREATSIDPDGMLTADAYLYRCEDPSCAGLSTILYKKDMGRVFVGKKFTLRIMWDKLQDKLFVGLNHKHVPLSYNSALNRGPAKSPFSSIRIRMELGACQSAPIEAEATTQVHEIRTNISAVIP
jgi:hypothetical protein